MRSWRTLSTFAVAGALVASTAYAADTWTPYERLAQPAEEVLAAPDMRDTSSAPAVMQGASIEGQVAAIDRESGRFVLDTAVGPISFVAWPDEVASLDIGDQVRVSFLQDTGY